MTRTSHPDHVLVSRHFDAEGRLIGLPVKHNRRLLVLRRLAEVLPAGEEIDETTVNSLLRRFHPDVALLRRYLVDEGLVERPRPGRYRRPEEPGDAAEPDPA